MPGIFISYRRDDSAGFAGRLADALGESFRPNLIFIDVTAIAPGIDFRKAIEQHVSVCDALLVVIGTRGAPAAAPRLGCRTPTI